jgi:hypothetical protein
VSAPQVDVVASLPPDFFCLRWLFALGVGSAGLDVAAETFTYDPLLVRGRHAGAGEETLDASTLGVAEVSKSRLGDERATRRRGRSEQLVVRDKVLFVSAGTNACTTNVRSVGRVDHKWNADLVLLLDHVGERWLAGGVLAANSGLAASFEPTKVGNRARSQNPRHQRCPAPSHGLLRAIGSKNHERLFLARGKQWGRTWRARGCKPLGSWLGWYD